MKTTDVEKVTVNWMERFGNDPSLEFLLKRGVGIKAQEEFMFERGKATNGNFYFAENEDEVRFFYHNPQHEDGYNGQAFTLNMRDATPCTIKGPWSSRAQVASQFVGTDVVDMGVRPGAGAVNSMCLLAYALTLNFVNEVLAVLAPELEMYEGDSGWYPKRRDSAPKNPRKAVTR